MRQYWGKDALKNRFVFNSPYPNLLRKQLQLYDIYGEPRKKYPQALDTITVP